MSIWRWLLRQTTPCAFCLARESAGRSKPARMAMMAMTTSNSMRVKPQGRMSVETILKNRR
jgi:hypothetical protein